MPIILLLLINYYYYYYFDHEAWGPVKASYSNGAELELVQESLERPGSLPSILVPQENEQKDQFTTRAHAVTSRIQMNEPILHTCI